MRIYFLIFALSMSTFSVAFAQTEELSIGTLDLKKKEKKVFNSRDSVLHLTIDTLIMGNNASLQFYGKKEVHMTIKHAFIANKAYFYGRGKDNNASNFEIDISFDKLGSLYVLARGEDAFNGTKTFPNGDGGNVRLRYDAEAIIPQVDKKKDEHYLFVDTNPGGLRGNPTSELRNIYSQIARSGSGLRGVPQGQIYSGSPGKEGKADIKAKQED